jgi:hypothetical protein
MHTLSNYNDTGILIVTPEAGRKKGEEKGDITDIR